MNRRMRAGFALVGVLVIVAISAVIAAAGWTQVTGSRRSLERIQVRRLVETAALSAIEEACTVLEEGNAALPSPGESDDLGSRVRWPSDFLPVEARADTAGGPVTIGTVQVVSSPWKTQREEADGQTRVRHLGILEFRVRVQVTSGGMTSSREVRVRRFACAVPASDDLSSVTLRIQGNNVTLQVVDA